MTDVVLIQMYFLIVGFKQKSKNENTEHDSIFIPFKVRSTQDKGILVFSRLGHGV